MIKSYKIVKILNRVRNLRPMLGMLLALGLLLTGCSGKGTEEIVSVTKAVRVQSAGKLMEIMHQAKVAAQLSLDSIQKEALFGLGAMEGLKGELIVFNGQSYIATVDGLGAVVSKDDSAKAALFVYAYVEEWDTLDIKGIGDVTKMIQQAVQENIDQEPFPFIILGEPQQLNYHIINFTGDTPNKQNHKEGALNGELKGQSIKILGFYANNKEGVYTHHGSKLHMHFLQNDEALSGHIDSLNIDNSLVKLLIPSS